MIRYADLPNRRPTLPLALGADAVPLRVKNELVQALLACKVIANPLTRLEMLNDFRFEIKTGIDYYPDHTIHVKSVVNRCLDISGGLEELAEVLRGSGEAPEKVAAVEERIRKILDRAW